MPPITKLVMANRKNNKFIFDLNNVKLLKIKNDTKLRFTTENMLSIFRKTNNNFF